MRRMFRSEEAKYFKWNELTQKEKDIVIKNFIKSHSENNLELSNEEALESLRDKKYFTKIIINGNIADIVLDDKNG